MSNVLGLGTTVIIRNIRNGQERFAAIVTSEAPEPGRFYVTKFNACKGNNLAMPSEPIKEIIRFDDGTSVKDGETYVIDEITGTPADIAKTMQEAIKTMVEMQKQIDTLKKDLLTRDEKQTQRLTSVCKTIAQAGDANFQDAVDKSLTSAVIVNIKLVKEESPKTPAPAIK